MSSCTQLVRLMERYGFKEIENDLNWLKELEEKGRLKEIFPNLKLNRYEYYSNKRGIGEEQ